MSKFSLCKDVTCVYGSTRSLLAFQNATVRVKRREIDAGKCQGIKPLLSLMYDVPVCVCGFEPSSTTCTQKDHWEKVNGKPEACSFG